MKAIRIVKCSDSMMWYRDKVGKVVEYLREDTDYLWSREPAGYSNIIKRGDGVVIDCILNDAQLSYVCNFIKDASCNTVVHTTYDDGMIKAAKESIIKQLREVHGQPI